MAITAFFYTNGVKAAYSSGLNWATDDIRCALTTVGYVPNQGTDEFFSSVTNEIVGTGYTAGGAALSVKTLTVAANVLKLAGANVSWGPGASFTGARRLVVYKNTGVPATSPVLSWADFGQDENINGTLQLTWDPEGILKLAATPAS